MAQIKDTLRQLRLDRGMTQEEVAEQVGLTRQAVSGYESGRTQPGIDILERLAQVYQVDLTDIISVQSTPFSTQALKQLKSGLCSRRLRVLLLCQAILCVAALLCLLIIPSQKQLVQPGAGEILLTQIRTFLAVPLCISSAVGLVFTTAHTLLARNPAQKSCLPRVLLAAALLLALSGIYWSVGFALFQVFPPLTFLTGVYIMDHRWIVSVWWCAASLLLSLSIVRFPAKSN